MTNFLDAVRERKKPVCTPDDAWQSATTVQLGMLAYYSGAKAGWDSKTEQVIGNADAARLIRREYRGPYKHPYSAA